MNKELLSFIRSLSENDKKTLMGKLAKTTEEVGELAKAVLPYENAAGTLHRFVNRRQILENAVDVMLCALSIAHDVDYSDEEIESMMLEKATKWKGLQANEDGVEFPLPFEIHVTVAHPDSVLTFKESCKSLNVKPIILDLENDGDVVMVDVMTSSVHFGDNNTAQKEAESIAERLADMGYNVVRVKIETVPWHPAAPRRNFKREMPANSYFESHLRIVSTIKRRPVMELMAKQHNAHLSRNVFKKIANEEFIIMMTLRDHDSDYESFKEKVEKLKTNLQDMSFVVDKMEIEFAVYDTNTTHDKTWINNLAVNARK